MHHPKKHHKGKGKDRKSITPDPTVGLDTKNDHSGTDTDADKTGSDQDEPQRYDKPKREVDPDTTEIDTDADKTNPKQPKRK